MVIMVVVLMLSITGATLSLNRLELKKTSNHKLGTQALGVADAGLQHAFAAMPAGINFPYNTETQVVPSTAISSLPGFTYSVKALNTAGGTQAILTSTALGPNGTKKVLVAYAKRGSYGFGAIHLEGAADTIETQFAGVSFEVNGNDFCGSAPAAPGISVTDPDLVTEITNDTLDDGGLTETQFSEVKGVGDDPSVIAIANPSTTVTDMADVFLALSHVELPGGNYGGNEVWGTKKAPRITWIKGNARINGNLEGYGVVVVDGNLDIAGDLEYKGIFIARGEVEVRVTGSAQIKGSLLIGESEIQDEAIELDIRGNAEIKYDSCVLGEVENLWVGATPTFNLDDASPDPQPSPSITSA
jgi:hypothetical protein